MVNREKCKICNQKGVSCCNTFPLMTEDEVGKIYFKYGIPDDCAIIRLNQGLLIANKSAIKKDGIHILNVKCPFLKNNECSIYEDRPKICRDYGTEKLKCEFYDLSIDEMRKYSKEELVKRAKFSKRDIFEYVRKEPILPLKFKKQVPLKKALRNIKEYAIMYFCTYYLQEAFDQSEFRKRFNITEEKKYNILLNEHGKLATAVQNSKYNSNNVVINGLFKTFSYMQNRLHLLDIDFVSIIVDKLNKLIKNLTTDKEEDDDYKQAWFLIIVAVTILNNYKNLKIAKKSLIKDLPLQNVLELFKLATKETGGFDDDKNTFNFNRYVQESIKKGNTIYNILMKNRW